MGATQNIKRERYSDLVDIKLRASLVTKDNYIFNTRYEGSPSAGAVIIPVRDGEVAVADYDQVNGINLTQQQTKAIRALVDKDKAVNELIDGWDIRTVPGNLVADRLDSAGYSLAKTMDKDALDLLGTAHTAEYPSNDPRNGKTAGTGVATASPFADLLLARTHQSNKYVPLEERYVIVSPEYYSKMLADKENFVKQGDLSQELVMSGAVGRIAGYNVYESALLPVGISAVCGHPDFATRVQEWKEPVFLDELHDGKHIRSVAVQGRMVYTQQITKPQAFYVITDAPGA